MRKENDATTFILQFTPNAWQENIRDAALAIINAWTDSVCAYTETLQFVTLNIFVSASQDLNNNPVEAVCNPSHSYAEKIGENWVPVELVGDGQFEPFKKVRICANGFERVVHKQRLVPYYGHPRRFTAQFYSRSIQRLCPIGTLCKRW